MKLLQATAVLAFVLIPFTAPAQNYPGSKQGEWGSRRISSFTPAR
jgi:hypothetical protein